MQYNNFILFSFLIVLLNACSPEDGFCIEEEYNGNDAFTCSEIDKYFSFSGSSINNFYTSKKADFSGTYILNNPEAGSDKNTLIEKPEYLPETITIEKMTECTIAPSRNGVSCNQHISFVFQTDDNNEIIFSSRNKDDFSQGLTLKYCTFKFKGQTMHGYSGNNEIGLYDIAVIDGKSFKLLHKYLLIEK